MDFYVCYFNGGVSVLHLLRLPNIGGAMLIECIDCGADIGCYIKNLKVKHDSIECHFACYYGLCQRNSTEKSGGLCKKCLEKALERLKEKRDEKRKFHRRGSV